MAKVISSGGANGCSGQTKKVYFGLFFSEETKKELLKRAPPKFKNVYADHVTYCFRPSDDEIERMRPLVGTKARVVVLCNCFNDEVQAAIVYIPPDGKQFMANPVPHCTISCADGIKPAKSNDLLGTFYLPPTPFETFEIAGEFDFFPRTPSSK